MRRFYQWQENRERKPGTLYFYRQHLDPFAQQYPQIPLILNPIETYIYEAKGGKANKHRRFRALRAFYYWVRDGFGIAIPPIKRACPSYKRPEPRALSLEEVARLFDGCEDRRDRLIIALCYICGMRVGELVSLRGESREGDFFRVFDKGNVAWSKTGERLVPIHPDALPYLEGMPATGLWFEGFKGPTHRSTISHRVHELLQKAGITDGHLGPHRLRHTVATHLVDAGTPLTAVKDFLGHTDINTTMIYVHTTPQDAAKHIARVPLGQMMRGGHGQPAQPDMFPEMPKQEPPAKPRANQKEPLSEGCLVAPFEWLEREQRERREAEERKPQAPGPDDSPAMKDAAKHVEDPPIFARHFQPKGGQDDKQQ